MSSKIFKNLTSKTAGMIVMQTIMSLILVMGIHGAVMAQSPSPAPPDTSTFNVTGYLSTTNQKQIYLQRGNPIASFIIQIINFLVYTIGSLCFLAIVIGGFILMTSHGNENSLTKGKDIIKYALIGLVVVLLSYFITAFVQSLLYEVPGK